MRACNVNPTLKTIKEVGGQAEKGQKMLSMEEVFPMFKACKESKDQGGFHDYVEVMKLYDKMGDNTMQYYELFKLLTKFGEKLSKEEAKHLMEELCEPEDVDGFTAFIRKFITFNTYDIKLFKLQPSWKECALLKHKNCEEQRLQYINILVCIRLLLIC